MNAAIYARKSTEQHGVADEAKSVARQVEHATAYATREGWTVAPEHVYVDDGVSGALFGAARPGLARLLNALRPRPAFNVLIMSEESRLGREAIETGYTLKQITDAGVAVWFYLENRQRTLDTAMDKVMLSLTTFGAELEREKASQRVYDTMIRKARAGAVTGGAVFGYTNQRGGDGNVHRVIAPAEAAVVRRIFDMAAAGAGYMRIARTLNDEGTAAPRARGSWSMGAVRDVLRRELYIGRVVWNREQKVIRGGRRERRQRPESEWLTVDVPALKVVDEATWAAARNRIAATRSAMTATGAGFPPSINPMESLHLLSGFVSCGACGGTMFAKSGVTYVCTSYHTRGRAVCKNGLETSVPDADAAVLDAVEQHVLRVDVLETSLAKAMELLQPSGDAMDGRRGMLTDELARLEAEVARLAGAIATGGELASLLTALQDRERRRAQLRRELDALDRERLATRRQRDLGGILDQLRGCLTDWQGMLRDEPPQARQALRALLAGRLVFSPQERDGERFYAFKGPGTLTPVLAGIVGLDVPKACGTGSGPLNQSDQRLPEVTADARENTGFELADPAQARVRLRAERTARRERGGCATHGVADRARVCADLSGTRGGEAHQRQILKERAGGVPGTMVPEHDPHRVARERVVDATRWPDRGIDEVPHTNGRRVHEVIAEIEQAQREIPPLVTDEERRPVSAGLEERLAPARRRPLEHVVGEELAVAPRVRIPGMAPVAAR
jgi:DNA invertase Pin-like site-specific DNA recombinase